MHPPLADALVAGEPAAELSSWLDAIAEITRAANRAAPLDELLDLIAGTTARLTGCGPAPAPSSLKHSTWNNPPGSSTDATPAT